MARMRAGLRGVRERCRDEPGFERWLEEAGDRLDPLMAWLGVLFALIVAFQLTVELGDATATALEVASWVLWAIFLIEFAVRLALAPSRVRFLRRHWLQIVVLAVPTLRVLRFLRLARLGRALPAGRVISSSYRSAGVARSLLRSRLGYLAAVVAIATLGLAQLVFVLERDHPSGRLDGFGDALLWAASTIVALQADPVPESVGGRLAMVAGFVFGLVVVASLAGTLGAYFVEERRERAAREG